MRKNIRAIIFFEYISKLVLRSAEIPFVYCTILKIGLKAKHKVPYRLRFSRGDVMIPSNMLVLSAKLHGTMTRLSCPEYKGSLRLNWNIVKKRLTLSEPKQTWWDLTGLSTLGMIVLLKLAISVKLYSLRAANSNATKRISRSTGNQIRWSNIQ